jgi:hypothetical protein
MKCRLAITLVLIVGLPVLAQAHTEIFFPKLFSPAELPTSGFVLLNPDPFPATVQIYLLSAAGATVSTTTFTIPSGGQLAKVGNELFPGVTTGGWVYVLNDTEGMQAFWLAYNSDITYMDGAEAAGYDTIGADQVIPLVAGQTEVNVINPNFQNVEISIRLFGSDGQLGSTVTRTLPFAGAFQGQVSGLFPSVDITQARYLRVTSSSVPIASSAVIKGYLVPVESVVVNGTNVGSRTELLFPHVINGALSAANFQTVIGVTNTSTSSQTVTIVFNSDAGNSITATRTIAGGGSLRDTAQALFSLPAEFQSGWVKINGTAALTGFAAYSETAGGGIAVVPAASAHTRLFFSHIANGPPQWGTGIALLNASNTPAVVEVYAINPSGVLLGGPLNGSTARFTLDPGKKTARTIDELVPQTQGVNGGFVFVTSVDNVALHAIELFYTRDLKVLSNVPAGKLVGGVVYAPPSSQE